MLGWLIDRHLQRRQAAEDLRRWSAQELLPLTPDQKEAAELFAEATRIGWVRLASDLRNGVYGDRWASARSALLGEPTDVRSEDTGPVREDR